MVQESKRPINDSGVVFVIVNAIWVGVGPLPWLLADLVNILSGMAATTS
jgi:hypothetical protein